MALDPSPAGSQIGSAQTDMPDDPFRCFMPYPACPVPHAPRGPLSGLTLAVKDLYDVAGYPTSAGNPHMLALSGIRTVTAPTVARLLAAGARFVGKTITDELAFSLNGRNAHFGTPVNPAAPDRIPGGSSSGSMAAVAGRLADVALGSDTGGSVRAPASYGGLFGIRPTHGAVSLDQVWPLAPSFDVAGWFARDGETLARVGEVLLPADRVSLPAKPRWLLATDALALAVPAAQTALRGVLARLSQRLGEPAEVEMITDGDALFWAFRHIQGHEAWAADGAIITRYGLELGPGVKERFSFSKGVTRKQYDEALEVAADLRNRLTSLMGRDGVILMPTVPDAAPLLASSEAELEDFRNRALRLLCLSVLSGCPQINVPVTHVDGAPFGISVFGPRGSDRSLIEAARQVADAAALRIA
jgi:amidase